MDCADGRPHCDGNHDLVSPEWRHFPWVIISNKQVINGQLIPVSLSRLLRPQTLSASLSLIQFSGASSIIAIFLPGLDRDLVFAEAVMAIFSSLEFWGFPRASV